jgi:hypothetical protein
LAFDTAVATQLAHRQGDGRGGQRLLRVIEDDDEGVIGVDDDGDVRTAPLGVVSGAVVGAVTVSSAR